MLSTAKTLAGYKLHSLDGEIGRAEEFYFDDRHWTIRYLVAKTGNWLTGRKVLLSPYLLTAVNKEEEYISVNLAKKQIEDSPSLDSDKPVSKQFEELYSEFYGVPMYWNGPDIWGASPYIVRDPQMLRTSIPGEKSWDHHLRSTVAVSGYSIQASDGEIGTVKDFIVDVENWTIRYLLVDTGKWLPGKKVLISLLWVERVSWDLSKVFVDISREAIKESPEYSEESLITRDYEARLCKHYNRQGYWID